MKKAYKTLLISIAVISLAVLSITVINEVRTYDDLSVEYIKDNSDECVLISTQRKLESSEFTYILARPPYYEPVDEMVKKGDEYYLQVYVERLENVGTLNKNGEYITIVQKAEPVITEKGHYIVFLNARPGEKDCYELSYGISSVIKFYVEEQRIEPLDKRLTVSVRRDIGKNFFDDVVDWFKENYNEK